MTALFNVCCPTETEVWKQKKEKKKQQREGEREKDKKREREKETPSVRQWRVRERDSLQIAFSEPETPRTVGFFRPLPLSLLGEGKDWHSPCRVQRIAADSLLKRPFEKAHSTETTQIARWCQGRASFSYTQASMCCVCLAILIIVWKVGTARFSLFSSSPEGSKRETCSNNGG